MVAPYVSFVLSKIFTLTPLLSNYRVNVFGFLCGPNVPAHDINAGIQDHFFAMNFIKNNAAALGGNGNKITVWGQSYGATMLEMEMLYLPQNQIKARGGILDSCTGPVYAFLPENIRNMSDRLIESTLRRSGSVLRAHGLLFLISLAAVLPQTLSPACKLFPKPSVFVHDLRRPY